MNDYIEIARRCISAETVTLKLQADSLDDNFTQAIELLLSMKGKLVITGVGKSGHIGGKIAATLSSLGTPAVCVSPLDLYHGDLGMIQEGDVVMAISFSGQTDELLRLLPNLTMRRIPIIGMSGNKDSLLARNSKVHINLRVEKEADPLGLAPTASTTAMLAVGDAVAACLSVAKGFSREDFARFHPGGTLGRRLLMKAEDVMHTQDLPIVAPETLMGEALICMSKGRLGLCVASVDGRVVGIVTDGDLRRSMERENGKFFGLRVEDVMTKCPKRVGRDARLHDIDRLMKENKIHSVLVEDEEGHLLGIVDSFSMMI